MSEIQSDGTEGAWPEAIAAITLFEEDLEAAKRFYQEVFELPVAFEDDASAVFKFGKRQRDDARALLAQRELKFANDLAASDRAKKAAEEAVTTANMRAHALADELQEAQNKIKELRPQLEAARAELEAKPVNDVAPLFGTELRDIRTKIERVKATTPPSYPPGFQLPGECFTKYGPVLAERRKDLYAIVERAYAAAHHVNENVRTRQARKGAHMLLGAIAEGGLDEAHGLAGEALDALGQAHNEPVESSLRRAARQVLEDLGGMDQ